MCDTVGIYGIQEVLLSTGVLPFPPTFSCCLVTGSTSDLPENLDKNLGFQILTKHHLSFLCVFFFPGCWAFITPNKLEVSTHVRVGRLTLRCSVSLFPEYAFPECSHRIQDSLPMVLSVFTKLLICWLPLFHPLP